jgi:hypothetical protein
MQMRIATTESVTVCTVDEKLIAFVEAAIRAARTPRLLRST